MDDKPRVMELFLRIGADVYLHVIRHSDTDEFVFGIMDNEGAYANLSLDGKQVDMLTRFIDGAF